VAAKQEGSDPRALLDVEHANAFGGVELVAGQAQQIDGALCKIQRHFADHLYGVGMERDAFAGHHLGDLLDGEDHTGLIVGVHDRDQCRVVVELVLQLMRSSRPSLSTPSSTTV